MTVLSKRQSRLRRRRRVRARITGTAERPRLSVYRSNRGVFAQLIDDGKGHTVLKHEGILDLATLESNGPITAITSGSEARAWTLAAPSGASGLPPSESSLATRSIAKPSRVGCC